MKRFIEGVDRSQTTLFPDRLEDWIDDDNPVHVIDVFVDELELSDLGFTRVAPLTAAILRSHERRAQLRHQQSRRESAF